MGKGSVNRYINLYVNGKQVENNIKSIKGEMKHLINKQAKMTRGSKEYVEAGKKIKHLSGIMRKHRSDIYGVSGAWNKMKLGVKNFVTSAVGGFATVTGAIYGIVRGVKSVIDAYRKQEVAEKKLEQAVRASGEAAGFSADELKKEAAALQKLTTIGDEDIMGGVTDQLLTFTNITGESFLQAQRSVMDVATVLSESGIPTFSELKSVSIQLGKALNDPIANMGTLSRSGIQFSEENKKLIKSLASTGKLAEAQAIMLEEVQKQYGGQAMAMAESMGRWVQLKNKIGDFFEKIGAKFARLAGFRKTEIELLQKENSELNLLVGASQNEEITKKSRLKLIKKINEKYPSFLGNLDAEKVTNKELNEKLADVNNQYEKKIKLLIAEELYNRSKEELAKLMDKETKLLLKNEKAKNRVIANENTMAQGNKFGWALAWKRKNAIINNTSRALEKNRKEQELVLSQTEQTIQRLEKLNVDLFNDDNTKTGGTGGTGGTGEKGKEQGYIEIERMEKAHSEKLLGIKNESDQDIIVADLISKEQLAWIDEQLNIAYEDSYMNYLQTRQNADETYYEWAKRKEEELAEMKKIALYSSLSVASNVFGQLVAMSEEGSKQAKAFSIIQAIIDTISSANAAYKSMIGVPIVGPVLAPIAAGTALAAGYKNVQKIKNTKIPSYAEGTDSHPGGYAVVGEGGPEIVNLPAGAEVIPNWASDVSNFNTNAMTQSLPAYATGTGGTESTALLNFLKKLDYRLNN
ncbi:MAG: hypothetical protein U9Q69_00155, partial [Nanoarchaeota archaeon]|nr:hypothetical protein [Nanoarchaeota archaeon]